MEQFVERRRSKSAILCEESGEKWLRVTEPADLANFVAFCKTPSRGRGRPVFMRGQHTRHPKVLPSLFRSTESGKTRTGLWAAYKDFLVTLPKHVRGTRFTRRNFGAVLQHYGFRTPWLDLVDDLHAAIWFALHECEQVDSRFAYRPTRSPDGWIVLIAVPRRAHLQNLREEQSSRNTRCNVQQGFSLAMQYDDAREPTAQQDFSGSVVGTLQIPTDGRWHVRGFRASQEYFFPSVELDDTYGQLLGSGVEGLAARAEEKHALESGALGRVARYRT